MNVYQTSFHGQMLERGFWLYIWRIKHKKSNSEHWYVGRTGDSSSPNAASPISRLSAHLNIKQKAKANTLIKNIHKVGLDPKFCQFKLASVGPVFAEQATFAEHVPFRDTVGKLEAEIAFTMREKGLSVLGTHPKRGNFDEELFSAAMKNFNTAFNW